MRLSLTLCGHDGDDRDSPYFKQHYREPIYQQLFDIADDNLDHTAVVMTGPFTREIAEVNWPERLSTALNAPVAIHYLYSPPDILHQRLIARGERRDNAKLSRWEEYLRYYQAQNAPRCRHLFIDTGQSK